MRKVNLLIFLLVLFLFACATPQADITVTTVPAETAFATASASIVPDQTSTPNLIPKQNDLIFIEFFAVT